MPVFSHVPVVGASRATKTTVSAASSSEIVFGKNIMFMIVADAAINLRFGNTGMSAATNADMLIPANTPMTFDLGEQFSAIRGFGSGNFFTLVLSRC